MPSSGWLFANPPLADASSLRLHPRLSCGGLALSANLKAFRESLFNPSSIVVCI
jgi:hypothetical protein